MGKYLFQVSYLPDGLKGLFKEGGSSRRDAIAKLAEGLGGKQEAFYYAIGDVDVFVIVDLPDNETAIALSMAVNASGTVSVKTTVLMTVEEIDSAVKKTIAYRPPGQ